MNTAITSSTAKYATNARGTVRVLTFKEEALLREHLLRLDPDSRHDRFNGFIDSDFIKRYAARSFAEGAIIVAYIEEGAVRGAAELHQADLKPKSLPEIAFSVESGWRRMGLGSLLFAKLIEKAEQLGYKQLRITTGAQNDAMRALAHKFGAHLVFRHGESTGTIELHPTEAGKPAKPRTAITAWAGVGRAWWDAYAKLYAPARRERGPGQPRPR